MAVNSAVRAIIVKFESAVPTTPMSVCEGGVPGGGGPSPLPADLRALLSPEALLLAEAFFETQLERHLTLKAIFEASKLSSEENVECIRRELVKQNEIVEEYGAKLEIAESRAREVEEQLEFSKNELRDARESLAIQKVGCENFRLQRDSAMEVRNSLSNMIETRNTEIECLKSTIENLKSQLHTAIQVRCEALAKNNEIESRTVSLNLKDRHLEQEKIGQTGQIDILKNELQRCTLDLHSVKTNLTTMKVNFERQLAQKIDQLNVANTKIAQLNEVKTDMNEKIENLNQLLAEQQEKESLVSEEHSNEIVTKTKLVELYKNAQDDSNKKNEELTSTIAELMQFQNESAEKYQELKHQMEATETKLKEIIDEKNESINLLRRELENANDLLQMTDMDMMNSTMDDLSPSAAIASKLIRSKMSITQAYDQLLKLSEDLAIEKNESKRLSHALTSIVRELEEKTPLIDRQKLEYEDSLEKNALLTERLESLIVETNGLSEEKKDFERRYKSLQRDNAKLKAELTDLSNQVCVLLKDGSERGRGIMYNHGNGDSPLVNGPQNLVTFRDINELQANNQKLLRLVRELSEKKEENEQSGNEQLEAKLKAFEERIGELTSAQDRQIKMMNQLVEQRDKYKKLCYENANSISVDASDNSFDLNNTTKSNAVDNKKLQHIELLETQLKDVKAELSREQEKYRKFSDKANSNEMKLLESNEKIHKQFTELQTKYNKCLCSSENINERVKVLQLELATYKKEISSLNQKINTYTSLAGKQESSIKKINEDLSSSRSKLSNAETIINNLQKECSALKDTKAAPVASQLRESCLDALKNIEIIKSSLLDGNSESVIRIQSTLEEANRTCTSLRCILQEEQEKYQTITSQLHNEIEDLKKRLQEEKVVSNNVTQQLNRARQEIENKKAHIDELKKNSFGHYSSEISDTFETPGDVKTKEKELNDYRTHIATLQEQLEISKNHIERYSNIYECSEKELKSIHSAFNEYKKVTEQKLEQVIQSEQSLKEKCANMETELSARSDELTISQNKINSLSLELTDLNNNFSTAILDVARLSENAQLAEEKYAHEIILHSNDIQALAQTKSQLSIANQNLNQLKQSKQDLESALKESKLNWESNKKMFIDENEDIKKQILDLTAQNSLLHDQIQVLSNKLSSLSGGSSKNADASDSSINTSMIVEDDTKSSEQLLNIVKYLRKERDVLINKFEIMEAEKIRMKAQLEITEARLDKDKLTSGDKVNVDPLSIKHSGVLRKVEELNAISDCYANLRKERDGLLGQIAELSESYKSLQETLAPTQENICELSVKVDLLQTENVTLKDEVDLWKNRVNTLIEKGDHDYPNDWKKIQSEHEALGKSLVVEKENCKKLTEEARKIKMENNNLEKQIERLNKQNAIMAENLKKHTVELTNCKQEIAKTNQELSQAKVLVEEKVKENSSNEAVLTESRMQGLQLRKIAKTYKTQYQELLKSMEEEKKKYETLASEAAIANGNHLEACKELEKKTMDIEKNSSEKISELSSQITSYSEENKKLQSEIEILKGSYLEKEEKTRLLLKTARAKIAHLTEAKETLTKELSESKDKVDVFEQNKDENDVRLQVIKSQYDGRMAKLEKEKTQLLQDKQAEINQLTKQIEALQAKLNQPPKPSTSSNPGEKPATEPPTANIKPMAGVASSPRDANRRMTGETPLASIRPMALHSGIRTAAILPTSAQTSNIHHQTPHTTGNISGDSAQSSSSSGLPHAAEYMPSSSSVTPRVVYPSHSRVVSLPPPESTRDIDGDNTVDPEMSCAVSAPSASPQSVTITQHAPQQGVALVMPRMESASESQSSHGYQQQASSSSGNSSATVTTSHGQNITAVTSGANKSDIQRAFKRPRVTSAAQPQQKIILKRPKTQVVSESDIEYQLPTSSQRDQEDDVNFSDLGEEGTYPDRAYVLEDDAEEDGDEQSNENRNEDNNDPEIEDPSRNIRDDLSRNVQSTPRPDNDNERITGSNSENASVDRPTISAPGSSVSLQEQQIETISSGNGIDSGFLVLGSPNVSVVTSGVITGTYEDGDDSIVPSTPTLYVPQRNDGFGEAVRSPMVPRGLIQSEGRFTFNESNTGGVMEDTHADLAPQLTPHNRTSTESVSTDSRPEVLESSEAEVGGSSSDANIVDEAANVEEGREAEASTTGPMNTPHRYHATRGIRPVRRMGSAHVHTPRPTEYQRPSPIVWSEGNFRRGHPNQQRGQQRGNRPMRRPSPYFRHF